mgnify:CR=1 FL=1
MKIYISASFNSQKRLRHPAAKLRALGHTVLSSWLDEGAKPAYLDQPTWEGRLAFTDSAEIFASDCVILDREGESTTGGRYVEWGMACAPGTVKLRITVGGGALRFFDHLADFHFPDWDHLMDWFKSLEIK